MVRELNPEELVTLKQGLRSSDAFTLRRCQILLASNHGHNPQQISAQLSCSDQCAGKPSMPSIGKDWPV
jgi:hypothetical protein